MARPFMMNGGFGPVVRQDSDRPAPEGGDERGAGDIETTGPALSMAGHG
ncbi:hypothetical protein [Oceanicaulis sp.]